MKIIWTSRKHHFFEICLLLFLVSFSSCRSIQPTEPLSITQAIPAQKAVSSTIIIPLEVDLTKYYKLADKQVPTEFDGGESPCSGVRFTYHFERDPLQLSTGLGNFKIGVSGKYRIKMSYCPECSDLFSTESMCVSPRIPFSCGYDEPMRKMKLEYLTEVDLTKEYGVETHTKLNLLKAIDPCEVTVFRYDATDELLKQVKKSLEKLAKDIDQKTGAVSFKKEASALWKQASTPIAIPGFGYVNLQPQRIEVLKPKLENNSVKSAIILEALPIFNTNKINTLVQKPLPELSQTNSLDNDTLNLNAELKLDYDSLSNIINRYASGKKIELKGKSITVDSLRISGVDSTYLIFKLSFSGDKKGVLYLKGRPIFDAENQTIQLSEIAFDIETKSVLIKSAKWLFSDRILTEIEKASKQDLRPQLNKLKTELNKNIHFKVDDFTLTGNISSILVKGIYPQNNELTVRVLAKGRLLFKN